MYTHLGFVFASALIVLAPHASADDEPWSFELVTAHSGAPIYYRLAWRNTTDAAVRVPADLLTRAEPQVSYCPPAGCRLRAGHGRMTTVNRPGGPPADSVVWTVVKPGEAVEKAAALASENCTPKGCDAGEYTATVQVAPRPLSGLASDQEVPSGDWERVLKTNAPTIAVDDDDAVSVVARFSRTPKGLRIKATVTNRLTVPLWVPRVSAVFVECPTRLVAADGTTQDQDMGTGAGGQSGYAEDEATLLAPGHSMRVDAACEVDIPEGTAHLEAGLRLVPFRPFEPRSAVSPLYFQGVARAPMVRVF